MSNGDDSSGLSAATFIEGWDPEKSIWNQPLQKGVSVDLVQVAKVIFFGVPFAIVFGVVEWISQAAIWLGNGISGALNFVRELLVLMTTGGSEAIDQPNSGTAPEPGQSRDLPGPADFLEWTFDTAEQAAGSAGLLGFVQAFLAVIALLLVLYYFRRWASG